MKIQKESVVSIHYTLTSDAGDVIDSSEGEQPLEYLHGFNNIVPGLEQALDGKSVGETVAVAVTPEEGYGTRNEQLVQEVPKSAFDGATDLEVGLQFTAMAEDGSHQMITIAKIDGDVITIDGNHPLAGTTLNFKVEIVSTRTATTEELQHGHVHGEGCEH